MIASRLDETKREKQIPTSLDLFMIMGVGLVIVAFGASIWATFLER